MLEKDISNAFTHSVKKKFMELGFPLSTSEELSELILPVKIDPMEKKVFSRCDNFFYLEQIIKPYQEEIHNIVRQCFGNEFDFIIDNTLKDSIPQAKTSLTNSPNSTENEQRSLSFKSFTTCGSNNDAVKACEFVITNQLKSFDPMFLFGETGLGKTHLLHATGQEFQKQLPHAHICYLSIHDFINEVIHKGIRLGKIEDIRNRYKTCDLLLVDDLDALEKKFACQTEFLNILNNVLQRKKHIIITSQKPPKEFKYVSERLKSIMLQGVLIEIRMPSLNDRIKILKNQSKSLDLKLSDFQIECIANAIEANIRELNGVLNDIVFQAKLNRTHLSQENNVTDIIFKRIQTKKHSSSQNLAHLQETVCKYFNVEPADLKSTTRVQHAALARHIVVYLAKHLLKLKTAEIIKAFERKHPKIVFYSSKKIIKLIQENFEIKAHVENITKKIL